MSRRVDYERIGDHWPELPDVGDAPPGYAQTVYQRLLPFSAERPLLFHILTTLGRPSEEVERQFLELAELGAALAPRRDIERGRAKKWREGSGMIFDMDRAAGDDRYVFTTPCNVFTGPHTHDRGRDIAVAFDAPSVMKAHDVAFRVSDLDRLYHHVATELGFSTYMSDEEDEEPRSPLDDEDVVHGIELAAAAGTQYEPADARRLLLIYGKLLSAFRRPDLSYVQRSSVAARIDNDDPERIAIYRAARRHFPDEGTVLELGRLVSMEGDHSGLLRWGPLFGEPDMVDIDPFPELLLSSPHDERPEFLVEGQLRLADAVFYRDRDMRWLKMPAAVRRKGRMVANPPVLIPASKPRRAATDTRLTENPLAGAGLRGR